MPVATWLPNYTEASCFHALQQLFLQPSFWRFVIQIILVPVFLVGTARPPPQRPGRVASSDHSPSAKL